MAAVYVVRSLVGEKLTLPGRPLLREWCVAEVPVAEMVGEMRDTVQELKRVRRVDVHLVVGGATVDERHWQTALQEPERAPPPVEPPPPTGASGVGLA